MQKTENRFVTELVVEFLKVSCMGGDGGLREYFEQLVELFPETKLRRDDLKMERLLKATEVQTVIIKLGEVELGYVDYYYGSGNICTGIINPHAMKEHAEFKRSQWLEYEPLTHLTTQKRWGM